MRCDQTDSLFSKISTGLQKRIIKRSVSGQKIARKKAAQCSHVMILGRISTRTVVVGEVIQIIQFCDKNCDRLYGISEHDYF